MRTLAKGLLALAGIGAAAVFGPATGSAHAQGFYIDAPGVHVGVGHRHRHYRQYYDDDYGAYGYAPRAYGYAPYGGGAYIGRSGYPQCTRPGFTFQDGACKPYRGY